MNWLCNVAWPYVPQNDAFLALVHTETITIKLCHNCICSDVLSWRWYELIWVKLHCVGFSRFPTSSLVNDSIVKIMSKCVCFTTSAHQGTQ